uniref:Putative ovule protein n=1 Tax=Solanum chacoense TaxID=4108 RepID=A0A0V0IQK1_SOLCH
MTRVGKQNTILNVDILDSNLLMVLILYLEKKGEGKQSVTIQEKLQITDTKLIPTYDRNLQNSKP